MNRALAVDWTDERMQRTWTAPRADDRMRTVQLARENTRLLDEVARLRGENADLAASAELWIKLYEAALARSNRPVRLVAIDERTAARQ